MHEQLSACTDMVELWANEQETEFGIKVSGEQDFKAISSRHAGIMFERIVDSSALQGESCDWPYAHDHWVYSRYSREVSLDNKAGGVAKSHTELLASP